uniref:Vesicle-trafficking protein SEC22c n=1 Tax=Pavo cristatus TaxID=9049 RepID=A0A8C9F9E5_PAVCR
MSMIFFACVVRVRDGLPLSASTDFHFNQDFLECRKKLKALSSVLARYPSRGTAKGRDLSIHKPILLDGWHLSLLATGVGWTSESWCLGINELCLELSPNPIPC